MNNSIKFLVSIISIFATQLVYAKSSIVIHPDFNVISVNGSTYKSGFFTSNSAIDLKAGINKLALEYEVVFDSDESDDFDIVKSDIFLLSFYATNKQVLQLQYLNNATVRAARNYAKNPVFSIKNQNNLLLSFNTWFIDSDSLSFVNQQTRPSLKGQSKLRITSSKPPQKTNKNLLSQKKNPDEMLMYWWNKATKEQRQSFMRKIQDKK